MKEAMRKRNVKHSRYIQAGELEVSECFGNTRGQGMIGTVLAPPAAGAYSVYFCRHKTHKKAVLGEGL